MKRILIVMETISLLFFVFLLLGCEQKTTPAAFTYAGAVYVNQNARAISPLENVSAMTGEYGYQINYDIAHPVQDGAAEPTKEMVFRGRSYPLTYKETIRRADGEAYHVYVLKYEDIDEAVLTTTQHYSGRCFFKS